MPAAIAAFRHYAMKLFDHTCAPAHLGLAGLDPGSVASLLCATAHPLYPILTNIFGTSVSEKTMRPNPSLTMLARVAGLRRFQTIRLSDFPHHTRHARGLHRHEQLLHTESRVGCPGRRRVVAPLRRRRCCTREKDAKLAQKMGQLQSFRDCSTLKCRRPKMTTVKNSQDY